MSKLQSGIVKWFDNDKGFGFIDNPDGPDIFLHFSQIESEGYRTVEKNQQVSFELRDGPKGLYAAQVRKSVTSAGIRSVYQLLLAENLKDLPEATEIDLNTDASLTDAALTAHRF